MWKLISDFKMYKKFEKDTITVCTGHSPAHLTCQEYVR